MEITITAEAAEKINERTANREGYLKLKYDTDGCGCAVNGVIALWYVTELENTDIEIETNDRTVYVEKSKMVFFDEQMKIDFSKATNCFQLKSPGQILNGHMSLILREKTD
ncbi:iron-sulfur cluster biosynthesis family protein [Neobacillus sp. NRS-1170]|uniref:iron-sulfur cluster biosynthesis family protein n=1 Tax=Neobacillus sp. NRS-1170 TaxID=3233898 RepID=UPI003D2D040D